MHYKVKDLPQISGIKNIFFVGIKGVGMTPIAIICHQAGFKVGGSDIKEEFITDKSLVSEGIEVDEGFSLFDIDQFFKQTKNSENLVITTGAHGGFDNPQVKFAREKGILVLTQGQALGALMEGGLFGREFKGVAIAGAHGKTTITSLLASSLVALGDDPTYSIGTGEILPIGSPGHYGRGDYFVAEADEYASEPVHDKIPKFLYLRPNYAIFNNIDFDHPDLFEDVESINDAFVEFANLIKSKGTLFINGDDKRLALFPEKIHKDIKIVKYGQMDDNDYVIKKIKCKELYCEFEVCRKKENLGIFRIEIPGEHNAKNAVGVIAFLTEVGFTPDAIRRAIKEFKGSKRRLEMIGRTRSGAIIFDDYGHHPDEIKATIDALRLAYPDKKIVAIFQSHTYSRTKALLKEFALSFKGADQLILLPVFASLRDTEKDILSNSEMLKAFQDVLPSTILIEKFGGVVEYVDTNYTTDEAVILTIGAGDVYKIANQLAKV